MALVIAGLTVAVFVLGLPGRIAIARKHPEAEAVNLMGWAGFMGHRAVDQGARLGFQAY